MATIKCLASQAKSINLHNNVGTKVMKYCSSIFLTDSLLSRQSPLNTLT